MSKLKQFPAGFFWLAFLSIFFLQSLHADAHNLDAPLDSPWLCSGLTAADLEAGSPLGGIEVSGGLELVRSLAEDDLHLALLVLMQMPVDGWLQAHAARPDVMASLFFEPASALGERGMGWVDGLEKTAEGTLSRKSYEQVFGELDELVKATGRLLDPDKALLAVANRRMASANELELELRSYMETLDEEEMEPVSRVPVGSVWTVRLERTDAPELPVLSDPAIDVSAPLFRVVEVVRSAD